MTVLKNKKCKICGNQIKGSAKYYCSRKCMGLDPEKKNKTKQTNLQRYGAELPTQNKEINDRRKQTNIKKYGFADPRSSDIVKEKIEATNIKKYGSRRPIQNEDIRQKMVSTKIEKYGSLYDLNDPRMREKWEKTNLERYGVINPAVLKEIQNKVEQTNLEKYGSRRPIQNLQIKEKIKHTVMEKYGVENVFLSPEVREKANQTNLEKYGDKFHVRKHNLPIFEKLNLYDWLYNEYVVLKKSATQIANETGTSVQTVCNYIHNTDILIKRINNFSYTAIQWLEKIMEEENIFIQHGGNIGEYEIPETNYFADGYCAETNTIYEYHGDMWHGNLLVYKPEEHCHPYRPNITAQELYNKTMKREEKIRKLGYNLITKWETSE